MFGLEKTKNQTKSSKELEIEHERLKRETRLFFEEMEQRLGPCADESHFSEQTKAEALALLKQLEEKHQLTM